MKRSNTLPVEGRTAQRRDAVSGVLSVLEHALAALDPEELDAVSDRLAIDVQTYDTEAPAAFARELAGEGYSRADRVALEHEALLAYFRRRRELLEDSLTSDQVKTILGTTRQTPYDRAKAGSLFAIKDRGAYRFPRWQFDPEQDDGLVPGIPALARALAVSPLAKISWMVRPNAFLGNKTPLACLRAGAVEQVTALARNVEYT